MRVRELLKAIERLKEKGLTDETLITLQVFTKNGVAESSLETLSLCFDAYYQESRPIDTYLALVAHEVGED